MSDRFRFEDEAMHQDWPGDSGGDFLRWKEREELKKDQEVDDHYRDWIRRGGGDRDTLPQEQEQSGNPAPDCGADAPPLS